jgi:hypothetical protein
VICETKPADSVLAVRKALAVIGMLALVACLLLSAANAVRASRHDPASPPIHATTTATEVIRVEYQDVHVDTFEVDTHDGGSWGDQSGTDQGG